jgi:pimeloyl-ACP methyl ester carboxylesterase
MNADALELRFVGLASGLRMGYVEAGPAEGEPVILLHGFPEFHYSWRFQLPVLAAAGYRAIAPDQRGYNRTDKTPPYDLGTLTFDVAQLQDALGIASSHIVGHDWGGAVLWAFASRYPGRVRRVVGLNAPHVNAYLDTVRRNPVQIARSQYITFFQLRGTAERALERGNYGFLDAMARQVRNGHMTPADVARYKDAAAQPGALTAMLEWYRTIAREVTVNRFRMRQMYVTRPALSVWGEQDPALVQGVNEAARKYVRDFTTIYLPKAGHWVQMDEPEVVNQLLVGFLGQRGEG